MESQSDCFCRYPTPWALRWKGEGELEAAEGGAQQCQRLQECIASPNEFRHIVPQLGQRTLPVRMPALDASVGAEESSLERFQVRDLHPAQ